MQYNTLITLPHSFSVTFSSPSPCLYFLSCSTFLSSYVCFDLSFLVDLSGCWWSCMCVPPTFPLTTTSIVHVCSLCSHVDVCGFVSFNSVIVRVVCLSAARCVGPHAAPWSTFLFFIFPSCFHLVSPWDLFLWYTRYSYRVIASDLFVRLRLQPVVPLQQFLFAPTFLIIFNFVSNYLICLFSFFFLFDLLLRVVSSHVQSGTFSDSGTCTCVRLCARRLNYTSPIWFGYMNQHKHLKTIDAHVYWCNRCLG